MSKKGFTMIPNQLIIDEGLSKEAKALFIYLRYLSPNFRILRNATLLTKLDMCLSTLQKAKNELIKEGYLVIHRKTSANKYELRLPTKQVPDRVPNTHMGKYQTLNIKKNNNISHNTILQKKGFKGFKK
jgi:hypothetical protein